MPDKAKIIRMTTELDNFIRTHRDIYLILEIFEPGIFSLLNTLNANNIRGVLTQNPYALNQGKIQAGNKIYPLMNFENALPAFNSQTGIIIFTNKFVPTPAMFFNLNIGKETLPIASFIITCQESREIYDRITITRILKQYRDDGILFDGVKDISVRFARGISTFTDPRSQNLKFKYLDISKSKITPCEINDTAIVIQGPLQYDDNYTLTTAKLYREWYPNAPIVISTWKNESTDAFRTECKKISVVILENDIPDEPGVSHVNYQIESSLKGVEYIKNNTSAKFVLKCRSDQRINKTKFLIYFKNLLEMYPPKDDKIKRRILLLGFSKQIPFFGVDLLYFGTVEDLNKLFNIPKQTKKYKEYYLRNTQRFKFILKNYSKVIKDKRKLINYNKFLYRYSPPEVYILKTFYDKYIQPVVPPKLLSVYWNFIKDYIIVSEDILLDWFKYSDDRQYSYFLSSDFGEWLDIYLHYKNVAE